MNINIEEEAEEIKVAILEAITGKNYHMASVINALIHALSACLEATFGDDRKLLTVNMEKVIAALIEGTKPNQKDYN